jgi:hypothetical protein
VPALFKYAACPKARRNRRYTATLKISFHFDAELGALALKITAIASSLPGLALQYSIISCATILPFLKFR